MIIKKKVTQILTTAGLLGSLLVTPAMALKYELKNVYVNSYAISSSALAAQLRKQLPKNVSPTKLKIMQRDVASISRKATSQLRSRSANGNKSVTIKICGRNLCVTIRFKRRRRNG